VPDGDTLICQGEVSALYSVVPVLGATSYEWRILPSTAGVVSSVTENATVIWNREFSGSATLIMRVTINNSVSEWSRLNLNVVLNTEMLNQSADTIICAKQPIILDVSATGYNLRYKWLRDGIPVQSGISSQLKIESATTDNSGSYTCEISGFCGVIYSSPVRLTVHPLTRISSVSPDVEVPFGNNITLKVNAEGHNLKYKWQKDGVVFENSNTSEFTLFRLDASDIGLYNTTVSGTCGTENSDTVYVYVRKEEQSDKPEVFLWPSVTQDVFNVALSDDAIYNVSIFNSSGQMLKRQINCRYQTLFNISTYAKGTYIINVFSRNFRKSLKLIKN